MKKTAAPLKALKAAFPHTIPIFAGFWFLGLTYGIYMRASGFSFWYPMLMSLTIFAGSIEFVTVNLLMSAFNPVQALAMTLMINARHLFYGISMLAKSQQRAGMIFFFQPLFQKNDDEHGGHYKIQPFCIKSKQGSENAAQG